MRSMVLGVFCAALFSSCASGSENIRVYGRIREVSPADVYAARVADRGHTHQPIQEVEVRSANEIRLHHGRETDPQETYDIIKRINGKWEYDGAGAFLVPRSQLHPGLTNR